MRSLVLAATGTAALSLAACGTSTIDAATPWLLFQ